ncbi:MAG: hypothetical protein V7609_1042 [Verrucomicrobiota bacterium]
MSESIGRRQDNKATGSTRGVLTLYVDLLFHRQFVPHLRQKPLKLCAVNARCITSLDLLNGRADSIPNRTFYSFIVCVIGDFSSMRPLGAHDMRTLLFSNEFTQFWRN